MRARLVAVVALSSSFLFACGGAESPPPAAPPPPVASAAPVESAAAPPPTASAAAAPAPAPEPTAEERKTVEEHKKLSDERAKWEQDNEAENARWTPEMHAAAKALAEKAYPSLTAAINAATAGKYRKPGNADRDQYRHPLKTLAFFGITPSMTVLEVSPGEGWFTELLAPTLAVKGKLLVTSTDPNGPQDQRSTFNGQKLKAFLERSPELFGKVQTIVVDNSAPKLGLSGTVDAVLLMREAHGMVNAGTLEAFLGEIHSALRSGGILGIEEHRAKPDADPMESSKKGYLPEKWLIEHVEAAGFKLAGKSEVNANPKDTKDYSAGVWALPPSLQLGDQDRAKYLAIGESDRMTLKFVKVADKPADGKSGKK
jgi:predicted methyltransferase